MRNSSDLASEQPCPALAWCPFPDRESALGAANTLLDEKLIACANLLGSIESVFEWQGERSSGKEVGVLLKTRSDLADQLVGRVTVLHPYEAPIILCWNCDVANNAAMQWLGELGVANIDGTKQT